MVYTKTEVVRLREELERKTKDRDYWMARHGEARDQILKTERRLSATQGVVTRIKNRVGKGVCPCCNRYFANVHRHMANQHPEFAAEQKGGA